MMKTNLKIKGMHCESCKILIEEVCMELKNVKSCNVDWKNGTAVVEHNNADIDLIKKEIESLSEYNVEVMK